VTRSIADKLRGTMRRLEALRPLGVLPMYNGFACLRCPSRRQRSVSLKRKINQPRSKGERLPARRCRVGDTSNHTASVVTNRSDPRAVAAPLTTAENNKSLNRCDKKYRRLGLSSESFWPVVNQIHGDNGTERLVSWHHLAGFDNTSTCLGCSRN
jgi:hypothetical protein